MQRRTQIATLFVAVILIQLLLVVMTHVAQATPANIPPIRTTFEPYGPENPEPMVVLMEYDPWRMVIGSDSPTFALYENGLVIYRAEDEIGYVSALLDFEERDALYAQIASDAFFALDDYYEATEWTDQPSNVIMLWDKNGQVKRVSVYGSLYAGGEIESESRANTPEAFLTAFDTLVNFSHAEAKAWLPEKFEVMLWPYDTSDSVRWPADWPDLDDPTTKPRGEDSYSVYVPIDELEAYFALQDSGSAVKLAGKTWAYGLRFPFPTEFLWMGE